MGRDGEVAQSAHPYPKPGREEKKRFSLLFLFGGKRSRHTQYITQGGEMGKEEEEQLAKWMRREEATKYGKWRMERYLVRSGCSYSRCRIVLRLELFSTS